MCDGCVYDRCHITRPQALRCLLQAQIPDQHVAYVTAAGPPSGPKPARIGGEPGWIRLADDRHRPVRTAGARHRSRHGRAEGGPDRPRRLGRGPHGSLHRSPPHRRRRRRAGPRAVVVDRLRCDPGGPRHQRRRLEGPRRQRHGPVDGHRPGRRARSPSGQRRDLDGQPRGTRRHRARRRSPRPSRDTSRASSGPGCATPAGHRRRPARTRSATSSGCSAPVPTCTPGPTPSWSRWTTSTPGSAVARSPSFDTISGTWVADIRNLRAVDYVPELIELAGIDRAKLPDLVPTGSRRR